MADPAEHYARAALRMRGFSSRRVRTSEGEVHLVERWCRGDGPTMVLIHGFGSAGVHLRPLLSRLTPSVRRLVAIDMPAHGFSEQPRSGMNPDHVMNALFEALDTVISEPAAIFGNSMGGYAAVRYALERPDRVRALMLASPAGARTDPAALEEIRSVFALDDHDKALEFIDRLLARPGLLRHFFAWGARRKLTKPELKSLMDSVDPDLHSLDPQAVQSLDIPTLLLWGDADRILPLQHREFWRTNLPERAVFEQLDGMGHSPFLERPGAVTERLLTFLSSLEDREG